MFYNTLPPGIRLDSWSTEPSPVPAQDSPEVAQLREELRKSMPRFTAMMELLARISLW